MPSRAEMEHLSGTSVDGSATTDGSLMTRDQYHRDKEKLTQESSNSQLNDE